MWMASQIIPLLILSIGTHDVLAQSRQDSGSLSKTEFMIGPKFIYMAENSFVLVRRGRAIGAFRLTRIQQDSAGIGKSTYESYYQGDGTRSLQDSNAIRKSGEIDIQPMAGLVHSLMWQPGLNKLWVGKWWFGCLTPSLVNMSEHFSEEDGGFEFAPTSAQSVAEINVNDSRLRWFRFNPDAGITVPVSELPK